MTKSRGLGRGLGSLIPNTIDPDLDPTAKTDRQFSRTRNVLISDIKPHPEQPRKEFSEQNLSDLSNSIKRHGVLQPVVVIAAEDGFLLVAGERRLRAARQAGLTEIPAIVRSLDAQAQLEVALIENIQREDLTPLEMATALVKLNQQFNQSFESIAQSIGKAHTTIINITRLLNLPEPAKRALKNAKISEGHARQILALGSDPKKQQELLDLIVRHGWNVRRAEQFVIAYKEGAATKQDAVRSTMSQTPETKKLSKRLSADVHLQKMAKGGRLVIRYQNNDELDNLTNRLLKA